MKVIRRHRYLYRVVLFVRYESVLVTIHNPIDMVSCYRLLFDPTISVQEEDQDDESVFVLEETVVLIGIVVVVLIVMVVVVVVVILLHPLCRSSYQNGICYVDRAIRYNVL